MLYSQLSQQSNNNELGMSLKSFNRRRRHQYSSPVSPPATKLMTNPRKLAYLYLVFPLG